MKAIKINLAGKDYYLLLNGAARYNLADLCGDKSITELIQPDTKESFDYLCKAIEILAEQGELARRYAGYDKSTCPTYDELHIIITPYEQLTLRLDVTNAVFLGYGREIKDDEKEVDLVLQELEKKTAKG